MKKILNLVMKYKIYSLIAVTIAVVVGGYFTYQKLVKAETVQYVSQAVTKGTLVTSISGTGQVSASSQIEIKPKVSSDVTGVKIKLGQSVKKGDVLVQLNAKDALVSLRNAQTSLETARLSLEKVKAPASNLSLIQSENSLLSAQQSKADAEDKLKKSYEDGFTTVSNAFLDLPTVMANLEDLLYNNDFESYQSNLDWYSWQGTARSSDSATNNRVITYKTDVETYYNKARALYDANFDQYKATNRNSSDAEITAVIMQTYETSKAISDTVKSTKNFIDLIKDLMLQNSYDTNIPAKMTTHQSSLETYTGKVNSHLSNLLSAKSNIESYKNSIINTTNTIKEKEASLADLKAGSDALDIRSAEISVQQKLDALYSAQSTLADYSIKAPFDGVVAALNTKVGDSASSGSSLVTIITTQSLATITLNEVDIAKVKVGQKATLTFDAVSDLTITGEVVEVDALGATNSGVVSYSVKIAFDVQDERIKSGMSASADIILESKTDVLMVPSNAIKNQNEQNYVQVLVNDQPENKNITIGSSNDTMTEVISGLAEGEQIITQTVTANSKTATTAKSSASTSRSGQSGPSEMRMMGF
jgi:HlyD family secretion protein